jgi:hypothetical protein
MGAHLRFFGAWTFLSASVLSPGTERTRMSALQTEAKPALEKPKMRTGDGVGVKRGPTMVGSNAEWRCAYC